MKARGTTLLIVDLQQALAAPPRLVEGIRRYARRFHRRIFTRFENPKGSLFRRKLGQRCCEPGSTDTRLLVAPLPRDLVINKDGYGLAAPDLRKLQRLGVKEVTVCGMDTDACVLAVMFSLFDAGISCRLKANLCWSSSGLQRTGLRIIRQQFPGLK
jgi:nicotinamidase-related amidase